MRIVRGKQVAAAVARIAARSAAVDESAEKTARKIIASVRRDGDKALLQLARKYDGLESRALRVPQSDLDDALGSVSAEFRKALETAARNIWRFCEWQKPAEFRREMQPGICVGQIVRPLASVGCYVPGGRYPLPSSLLMTVIPAQVAGVQRIAVASPRPAGETLAAAALCGVTEFYRIGGAQAIAAFAYGTTSVPRVHKIVGPGNRFVTAAKKAVAFDCGIDFLAGPTEVLIVSDNGNPEFIAADLVAQAEHDPDACAIFITSSLELAREVKDAVARHSFGNIVARESLSAKGEILVSSSREQAIEWANAIGPEHITVDEEDVPNISSAGSIFVGGYSPQALGDYAAGPNHVLPTGNVARFRGGLSVTDFVKVISVQQVSKAGLQQIAPVVEALAEAEGLKAHAQSVRTRCANA
jgi:histidinol dehydrogenase